MKKSDKFIYFLIKVIGIITIIGISYFIIFSIMNLMNTTEYSKILIDLNIYRPFYITLNFITNLAIPLFLIIFFIAIPYLIVSIILCIVFLRKYIKYNGEKKNQIRKIIILGILTTCLVIRGVSLFPLTSQYEIKVNSKIDEISNTEVRDFLKRELTGNKYIYKIEIHQGFSDDYNVKIYYQDTIRKVTNSFLSDNYYDFINRNAKDLTNELIIKSITLTLIGDILCIYSFIYVLREFKKISIIKNE